MQHENNLLDHMIRIADERGMPAPYGLKYGFRSVRPDFTSRKDYRWPFPGNWADASGPFHSSNTRGCPVVPGDGICIANTWEGMASGNIPAISLLLVGYFPEDVLGVQSDNTKLRVKRAYVRDLIDGPALIRQYGNGADLTGANLRCADLSNAYFINANLTNADLTNADLTNANLYGADLTNADLTNADLRYANLSNANLSNANLNRANLNRANLGDWERGPNGYAVKVTTE